MASKLLTALEFSNLKPGEKDRLIKDGDNLYISLRSIDNGGSKSFRMTYRIGSKKYWLTLKASTLSNARKERDAYKQMLKDGKDPSLERKLQQQRSRQSQIAEQEALAKLAARMTVKDLFIRWRDTDLIQRKDIKEVIRMFEKDVLPVIGDLFVEDVRKGNVIHVTDILKQRSVNHLARNLLKLMRQMFRFAVDRGIIEFDPTASLSIAKTTTKPTERDRVLSEVEIRALARQLPSAGLLKTTECAIWICLSTMCRIGELSKARFEDIDIDAKAWTIPEENSKNSKRHVIYLSAFALKQFVELKRLAANEVWIFPNRDGSSHVCEKSITKQISGRQVCNVLSHRSKEIASLVLTVGNWTPHDLRRTGATMMGNLGINPDVIEKCLNHTEENKIKRIYQRQKLEVE